VSNVTNHLELPRLHGLCPTRWNYAYARSRDGKYGSALRWRVKCYTTKIEGTINGRHRYQILLAQKPALFSSKTQLVHSKARATPEMAEEYEGEKFA